MNTNHRSRLAAGIGLVLMLLGALLAIAPNAGATSGNSDIGLYGVELSSATYDPGSDETTFVYEYLGPDGEDISHVVIGAFCATPVGYGASDFQKSQNPTGATGIKIEGVDVGATISFTFSGELETRASGASFTLVKSDSRGVSVDGPDCTIPDSDPAFENLNLIPDCLDGEVWRFRVRNPNAGPVDFSWDVYGTDRSGSGTAAAESDTRLEVPVGTDLGEGASETVRLFFAKPDTESRTMKTKASNTTPCETVEPVLDDLQLTAVCSDVVGEAHFRVTNTNAEAVAFTWENLDSGDSGQATAAAATEADPGYTYFTLADTDAADTTVIRVGGVEQEKGRKAWSGEICTFDLTVHKQWEGQQPEADFRVTASYGERTTTFPSEGGEPIQVPVDGATYEVVEDGPDGWTATGTGTFGFDPDGDFVTCEAGAFKGQTTWSCVHTVVNTPETTPETTPTVPTATEVTEPAPGPATLVVFKRVTGADVPDDWAVELELLGDGVVEGIELDGDDPMATFDELDPGGYTVTELDPDGGDLVAASCFSAGEEVESDLEGDTLSVDLAADASVTCTFVNDYADVLGDQVDNTTPTTTPETPTTEPPAVDGADDEPTPTVQGDVTVRQLPRTGSGTMSLAGFGVGLLILGAGLLLGSRRQHAVSA